MDIAKIISLAEKYGSDYVSIRVQERIYERIVVDNGVLREYSVERRNGLGIRVIIDKYEGFASTNDFSSRSIEETVEKAVKIAKSMKMSGSKVEFAERSVYKDKVISSYKVDPFDIDSSEKIKIVMEANRVGRSVKGVVNVVTFLGSELDKRIVVTNLGDEVEVVVRLIGLGNLSVASHNGVMERVYDSLSRVAGWEFIEGNDWNNFVEEVSKLASEAAQAPAVKPGVYTAVLDNQMVGLMLHEAFGHATEGDIVHSGDSVLLGKLGTRVASEYVTIVDDGLIEGGYYVPYDDEGTKKERTITVEKGILKSYLHSLYTARKLGGKPTGNARAMYYSSPVLVRQTNTYMMPGNYRVEELFEDIKHGLYIRGRGALGGEVDTAMGTFTFTAGPSYIIENGEVTKLVRGVMLSGNILETLKNVDAVANDLKIHTSVFGGCGKGGQLVRVGDGGPHVRVKKITIGGGR